MVLKIIRAIDFQWLAFAKCEAKGRRRDNCFVYGVFVLLGPPLVMNHAISRAMGEHKSLISGEEFLDR